MRKALLWIAFLCWLGAAIKYARAENVKANQCQRASEG